MNTKLCLRSAITLACAALGAVAATAPVAARADGNSANRIVGLWDTQAEVRPCGTDLPPNKIANTLLIHAGGTIVENPRYPPGGAPNAAGHYERNQALGTWVFNRKTGRYWIHLRFDNFLDTVYDGYSEVDREVRIKKGGMEFVGPVWASRYDADGNLLFKLCGSAVSSRL